MKAFTLSPSDGAAATTRWQRTERLPFPGVAALTPIEEEALLSVDSFVDRLVELPLFMWLAIGIELMAEPEGLVVRQRAWCDVEAAIAEAGLGITAWHVRDAVETTACLVSRRQSRWSRAERCRFAATHGAADAAALALLAQPHIPAETLRVLRRPFAASLQPMGSGAKVTAEIQSD